MAASAITGVNLPVFTLTVFSISGCVVVVSSSVLIVLEALFVGDILGIWSPELPVVDEEEVVSVPSETG
jgi:hypothetical protein